MIKGPGRRQLAAGCDVMEAACRERHNRQSIMPLGVGWQHLLVPSHDQGSHSGRGRADGGDFACNRVWEIPLASEMSDPELGTQIGRKGEPVIDDADRRECPMANTKNGIVDHGVSRLETRDLEDDRDRVLSSNGIQRLETKSLCMSREFCRTDCLRHALHLPLASGALPGHSFGSRHQSKSWLRGGLELPLAAPFGKARPASAELPFRCVDHQGKLTESDTDHDND